jgi:hypothetical protein
MPDNAQVAYASYYKHLDAAKSVDMVVTMLCMAGSPATPPSYVAEVRTTRLRKGDSLFVRGRISATPNDALQELLNTSGLALADVVGHYELDRPHAPLRSKILARGSVVCPKPLP